ncbi:MAG: alpha/beta hydrolase family esterase [Fimbriimonas sp.]
MLAAAMVLLVTGPGVKTIRVDGVEREALVCASNSAKPAPLVFAFHGYGGNMRRAAANFRLHEHWPEAVVVYLQGLPSLNPRDPANQRPGWDVMRAQNDNRDVRFVDALLADLKKDYKIDEKRVFAMGHSNGGRFGYLLWGQRGDTFRAFSMCGSNSVGFEDRLKPKSAFLIGGLGDATVPIANQRRTAAFLMDLLKVDPAPARSSEGYKLYKGAGNLELATYFHSGGHEYPADAGKMVVDFFRRVGSRK